jgi:exosortase C (VPDSG-CTERM-specific)
VIKSEPIAPPPLARPEAFPLRIRGLAAFAVVLMICFARPLWTLAGYSLHSELYSHILLIPLISLYLIWPKRRNLALDSLPARGFAWLPMLVGASLLLACLLALRSGWKPAAEDYLALMTFSFLSFLAGGCFLFLGKETLRQIAFPAAFLIFLAPFPVFLRQAIESFFQHGSAAAADVLFWLSGMSVFREGMDFHLPGFSLQVAPQCSGIRSSLVLFITSLVAGHLFLVSPWRRAILTLAVIPLALVRNGIRIVTIGQLCVRVSPDMIDSYIHTHGGPIFFLLSLVPFFLLLLLLRRQEKRSSDLQLTK